jgi:hypothetical protein
MAVVSDSHETKKKIQIFIRKYMSGWKNLGEVGEDGKIISKFVLK